MKEIQGKYTSAKIFTDNIEDSAIKQVEDIYNHPIFKDCKIRFMPDCHTGKSKKIEIKEIML